MTGADPQLLAGVRHGHNRDLVETDQQLAHGNKFRQRQGLPDLDGVEHLKIRRVPAPRRGPSHHHQIRSDAKRRIVLSAAKRRENRSQ